MAGIGRAATPAEIRAWDIDVRPDFKGLPAGRGNVEKGLELWEAKCASCHGVFGESNEVFTPLVGGTTAKDIEQGTVEALSQGGPRTTLMKVATLSTLWDYIRRAMPWNEPKSLAPDDVYAVLAYLLNLGGIVPDDFELSDTNIAEVQQRMPNRDGMTQRHGLWAVDGTPDVKAVACMTDCPSGGSGGADALAVSSRLPEHARDAHGNLADQQRALGPVRGALTDRPAPASFDETRRLAAAIVPLPGGAAVGAGGASGTGAAAGAPGEGEPMLAAAGCLACHGVDKKLVGPAFRDVYDKHKSRADLQAYLVGKIRGGGQGVWGSIPMPPQPTVADADVQRIAAWLANGAK
ncbi:MAG: c-type cytochrome [Lautropia sp.]